MIRIISILAATLAALGYADYADLLNSVLPLIPDWLHAFSMVIAAAAAVTALTPTRRDDRVLVKIKKFLNALGLNFGAARNKEDDDNV